MVYKKLVIFLPRLCFLIFAKIHLGLFLMCLLIYNKISQKFLKIAQKVAKIRQKRVSSLKYFLIEYKSLGRFLRLKNLGLCVSYKGVSYKLYCVYIWILRLPRHAYRKGVKERRPWMNAALEWTPHLNPRKFKEGRPWKKAAQKTPTPKMAQNSHFCPKNGPKWPMGNSGVEEI